MPASDKAGEQKKLPGIFISYRRSDTPDAVGRIYDRLIAEFGKSRVFKDVDSIPLGQDFRGHLNDIVGGCAVVLAIIGPRWVDARNSAGQRRLEDADDFVRIELEAALARSVPVVPVLVAHAPIPGTSELPASLASMAFRQSIEVRPDPDFHNDATRLVVALRAIIDPDARQPVPIAQATQPKSWVPWVLFVAATIASIAFAIPAMKFLRQSPPLETRIAIDLPADNVNNFAFSPDGRQIVYRASDDIQHRLWLRSLSATTAQPLPGTEGALNPFWSPDGRSIGLFVSGALKRLDLGGGQPQALTSVVASVQTPYAGVWDANGDILFSSENQPIFRIASSGGAVTAVTKLAANEASHLIFSVLPDGRHFLFMVIGGKSEGNYIGTLDGSPPVRLTADIGPMAYLPSGWMVWIPIDVTKGPKGPLLAQRLDLRNARLTGEPVSIAGGVSDFSASTTGLIAFATARATAPLQLTWVDRSGKELGTIGEADSTLSDPRVAPDGRRVVVSKSAQGNADLWLLDGTRSSRMTFDTAEDGGPVWSPDGLRITFTSNRSGNFSLYQKLASVAGGEERIQTPDQGAYPNGWSADGKYLSYDSVGAKGAVGISVLPASGDRKPFAFLQSAFIKVRGQFSPDGRWVVYQSNESGMFEVFVRSFIPPGSADSKGTSNLAATQWMVSTAGGVSPMWSPDGKELYYINPAGEMMAVPITVTGSALMPGTPVKLFDAHSLGGGSVSQPGRQYDVAPDGRFLINRVRDANAALTVTLIQNWNPDVGK